MFGLSFEKLVVVGFIAALVIGPQRLPDYTRQLAHYIREFKAFVHGRTTAAEADLGVSLDRSTWTEDLRSLDPRRIVREALTEAADPSPAPVAPAYTAEVWEQASRVRPGQRFIAVGSAAHPQRLRIDALPADDPRRLAAQTPPAQIGG